MNFAGWYVSSSLRTLLLAVPDDLGSTVLLIAALAVQAHICYCQPCHPITPSVYHKFGAVGANAFTIIVAVVPAIFVIACVALGLYLFQMRTRNQQLLPKMIPFSELKITSESTVLYQGVVTACTCPSNQDGQDCTSVLDCGCFD